MGIRCGKDRSVAVSQRAATARLREASLRPPVSNLRPIETGHLVAGNGPRYVAGMLLSLQMQQATDRRAEAKCQFALSVLKRHAEAVVVLPSECGQTEPKSDTQRSCRFPFGHPWVLRGMTWSAGKLIVSTASHFDGYPAPKCDLQLALRSRSRRNPASLTWRNGNVD